MVLLVASFIVYQLTAISGDPLLELRGSRDPDIQFKIQYLTEILQLDVPPFIRYFYWLAVQRAASLGNAI